MVKAVKGAEPAPEGGNGTRRANAMYTQAQTRLREAHREEFVKILEGVYQENGLEYKHKRTPEERKAAEAEAKRAKAQERIRDMVREWGPSIVADAAVEDTPDTV